MASASHRLSLVPERPDVWQGDRLSVSESPAWPTGHAALDACLPGGGWPAAGLVELLQARSALHDWQLLLPALAGLTATAPAASPFCTGPAGPVVLIGAPPDCVPFVPSLAAQGLPPERLLWIDTAEEAARLWAGEQALRCAEVPAVLAWLPRVRADALRRLHLAALDNAKPLFVFRPAGARHEASAAPLRLWLDGREPGRLEVEVLKRRGPPLARPVSLAARGSRLAALLDAPVGPESPRIRPAPPPRRRLGVVHALDRAAAA